MSEFGHVKISRKAFASDRFWNEPREFSKWEAWLWMIQAAAWKDYTRVVGMTAVPIKRGEVLASLRFQADAWGWSVKKVRNFVQLLAEMGRVKAQQETQAGTVYLIVNYSLYQSTPTDTGTQENDNGAQKGHGEGTVRAQRRSSKSSKRKKTTLSSSPNVDLAREVFDYWRSTCGHEQATPTPDRMAKINARLKRFSPEQLHAAIDGAAASPFHQGDNDRATRYDFPETIFKNDAAAERLMFSQNGAHPKSRNLKPGEVL